MEKKLISWKTVKKKKNTWKFFAQKDKNFWEDGIVKLPERRQEVMEQNGEYVVQ